MVSGAVVVEVDAGAADTAAADVVVAVSDVPASGTEAASAAVVVVVVSVPGAAGNGMDA